ncbi:glycosyltransferase [Micromonospora sp. WMMD558]|uniref:glycosyltransferase n=1 Tax=unclassified Micromonospora TaxID=2617518 RepID=UPI0012B459D0|nr:glycosyltransferase [Micromonospora sp. WMMC415]QGN49551.1 glycosyltransferase [Micromonospora sp. WMMC415]
MATDTTLLLFDISPYRHSTRTRKIAMTVASGLPGIVRAVTLSRAGRFGAADETGRSWIDGVDVEHLPVRRIDDRRRLVASVRNLVGVYLPGVWRLRRRVLATPAKTVFVGHISLFWIGLAHRRRWGSHVVLNGRERPGGIRTKGSLATWFSRVEPQLLRRVARQRGLTVVAVCESNAVAFRKLGFDDVMVVRNVPLASFAPEFVPPPSGPELVVACVGTLYPGRGLEVLIDAVADARSAGARVRLEITGPASEDYRQALRSRIVRLGAQSYVSLDGPCSAADVPSRYQRAHVSTALYQPVDPANDGLSNKLFEAVVAGRPVIAGNLPENRALIEKYRVGWAVPVEPAPLSELLARLAEDLTELRALARHCFVTGRAEFVWEAETALLQKRLLENFRGGAGQSGATAEKGRGR